MGDDVAAVQLAAATVDERVPGAAAFRRARELAPVRPRLSALRRPGPVVALALVALSVVFVAVAGVRPAYDAYGWLVWGRQALHLHLDTSAAPSWKPLTFLFTLPYALAGGAAVFLWMVTAVAGALAGGVFGARIAYRLAGPCPRRPWAPWAAAAFAGLGVLGIDGYGHFTLIAYSDPMIVTLCLAALDCALSGRQRMAWALLVLASLGRPEAWPLAVAYTAWSWRAAPQRRHELIVGWALIGSLWFVIPGLTSPSWTSAGDVARSSGAPVAGDRLTGVLDRFLSLYELPMQLAVGGAMVLAVVRRERAWLLTAAAAWTWVAAEVAFAYHGWPASPRYMFEPAAVLVVVTGAAVGRVLAIESSARTLRWLGVAAVAAVVLTLAPQARLRARLLHNGIVLGRAWARQLHRLHDVIAADGGARKVLACGYPVTYTPYQSIVAWELGVNVADVSYDPPAASRAGGPIVFFDPYSIAGWHVKPQHLAAATRASCAGLRRDTAAA